jgi:hypothetical protein
MKINKINEDLKYKILKSFVKIKNLKNKLIDILYTEAKDNKELAKLLIKIANEKNITDEEKTQIINQLSDNAKLIIGGALIVLPASSVIIPLIIYIANKLNINYKTSQTFKNDSNK